MVIDVALYYLVLLIFLCGCTSLKKSNNPHGGQTRVNHPPVNSAESNGAATVGTVPNGATQQAPGTCGIFLDFFWGGGMLPCWFCSAWHSMFGYVIWWIYGCECMCWRFTG